MVHVLLLLPLPSPLSHRPWRRGGAPDNAVRNFAAAVILSPYGTADLAGAQGDPQDSGWRAASACARHCQRLAYLSAGLWQHVSRPDPLRMGPPGPADVSEGAEASHALRNVPRYRMLQVGASWNVPLDRPARYAASFLEALGTHRAHPADAPEDHVADPAELED